MGIDNLDHALAVTVKQNGLGCPMVPPQMTCDITVEPR